MSDDKRFPKASLFSVRWCGWPKKHYRCGRTWWLYMRIANAAILYVGPIELSWRMPWSREAIYSKGWNDCFIQMACREAAA